MMQSYLIVMVTTSNYENKIEDDRNIENQKLKIKYIYL